MEINALQYVTWIWYVYKWKYQFRQGKACILENLSNQLYYMLQKFFIFKLYFNPGRWDRTPKYIALRAVKYLRRLTILFNTKSTTITCIFTLHLFMIIIPLPLFRTNASMLLFTGQIIQTWLYLHCCRSGYFVLTHLGLHHQVSNKRKKQDIQ